MNEILITVGITIVSTCAIIGVIAFILIRVQVENDMKDFRETVPNYYKAPPKKQKHDIYFNSSRQSLVHNKDYQHGYLVGILTDKNTRKLKSFLSKNSVSTTEIKKIIQVLNTKAK